MGRMELSLGKVIEPLPGFSTIPACVHTGDCGQDLSIWPRRIHFDAIGANVGAYFVFRPMQKKSRMGHSRDGVCIYGLVNTPARGQMKTPHRSHSMDRRIRPNSLHKSPFPCSQIKTVNLVARSHIERAWMPHLCVIKLHGEDIQVGWEMGECPILHP